MQTLIVLLGLGWMFCSYYFILQTKYSFSEELVQNEDILRQPVVEISNGGNAYLQEQSDGTYIFHYNGKEIEVPSSDVDAGLYAFYPIIEYEDDENIFEVLLQKLQKILIK